MPPASANSQLAPNIREQISLLVFDLDGVITSEQKYWNVARLTIWELLEHERYLGRAGYFGLDHNEGMLCEQPAQLAAQVIPDDLIYRIKQRAINSNWDLTFLAASLHILAVLHAAASAAPEVLAERLRFGLPLAEQLRAVQPLLPASHGDRQAGNALIARFLEQAGERRAEALLGFVEPFASELLAQPAPIFAPRGEVWQLCYHIFQDWFRGRHPLQETIGSAAALLHESTIVDERQIEAVLRHLRQTGRYTLGIATGRPQQEALEPLRSAGLLGYFAEQRIVTNDDVAGAEQVLEQRGQALRLGKPHPFVLLRAIYPEKSLEELLVLSSQTLHHTQVAFIGDAPSDILAAQQAGCVSIGVLTGPGGEAARAARYQQLHSLGCHLILDDVRQLPQALGLTGSA